MNPREPTPPWAIVLVSVGALVAAWIIGREIGSVVILFALSTVLAMLLNPAVRQLRRLGLSRGLAVLVLVVIVLLLVVGLIAVLIDPIRSEVQVVQNNLPTYSTHANQRIDSIQRFFDSHGIKIKIRLQLHHAVVGVQHWADRAASNVLSYSLGVLSFLISLIVVVAATTYMLLDASRIVDFAERLGGPGAAGLLRRTERTLVQYIKAQVIISLIMGFSAGLAMYLLGVSGIFPPGETFAIIFGVWVFFAEFIPYVGPILGALPPLLLAFVTSPLALVSVAITFIVIQQLEGHVVVPNVMASAVGVHPLVVIFGLLIGEALAGVAGVLLAIPMVVIVKELITYAGDYFAGDTSEFDEVPEESDPP